MGIPDLDLMFDLLDTDLNGYLTSRQLQDFQEELYFSRFDSKQIDAAIATICGHNSDGKCSREHFTTVLDEIERRRTLEEKIIWDFKTLDMEGNGRISLKSTLFLFKTVHGEYFSLKTWQTFVRERKGNEDGVSFDEIKMFLCNLLSGGPCDEGEFLDAESELEREMCNRDYQNFRDLQALQEDEASIALEERNRLDSREKMKKGADRLVRRLDHEGLPALLHDGEDYKETSERKAREKVSATELIEALRNKYDVLRGNLLLEMLKFQVGEGMWTVLSEQEQQERLMQLKLHVRKLRKEGKLEAAAGLPGASQVYPETLLALMDYSRQGKKRQREQEEGLKKRFRDEGKTEKEVEEDLIRLKDEAVQGTVTSDKMLISLEARYQGDKDVLTARLRGADGQTMTSEERLAEFVLLVREYLRGKHEHKFESCAPAVGMAETPQARVDSSLQDRKRQEKLASERLIYRKGRKLQKEMFGDDFKLIENETGLVDIHENIVKALEKKHATERELLIFMLQGRDSGHARSAARKLSPDERANQLLVLKMQRQSWRSSSSEERTASKDRHRSIMQEAVGIVFENRRVELRETRGAGVDETVVSTALLSDLQEQQDAESQLLLSLVDKDSQELLRIKQQQLQACSEEWVDNISAVLLGTEDVTSQEDELVKALEDKYDTLRDKLLLEALMKQYGEAEWARLSERERQTLLTKLKLQEKRLRQQGKFDEAARLLGDAFKDADLLQSLLGENRQKYLDKLRERLARRQRLIDEGLDPDEEDEETMRMLEEEQAKGTGNILMDLQNRFDDEKDSLLRRLREQQDRLLAERQRQAELARLRREKRQTELEGRFDSAALVLGLAERNRQNLEERLRRDRERQEQLARERLAARRGRRGRPEDEKEEPEPDKEDIAAWQDSVLKELEKKHRLEREFLMSLVQEEGSVDLREEARGMPEDERLKAIQELKDKRDELDFGVKADQEMNIDILDMAASYKVVIRQEKMKRETEKDVTDEDAMVAIVADVQEEQDKECEMVLEQIQGKSQPELALLRKKQIQARKEESYENVATVALRYDGGGTDDELMKALDKKYDALKDKLLLEALKKQMSDAEWAALSEKERQRRLMQLKLEEKRLRKEGKLDELQRLLGEGFAMDANLRKLMGENKARYEENLKERLARRRQRLSQGLPPDDEEDLGEEEADGAPTDAKAVLDDLDKRYEEERDALMRKLRGDDERFLTEKQRQAELARLKREQLKAKQEGDFYTAALVLGLAERNRMAVEERLKQDRLRQEQLARERLALRRNRSKKDEEEEAKLVTEGDLVTLQDAVMKAVERKHRKERDVFVELLQDEQPDLVNSAQAMTQEEREARLEELKTKRAATDSGDKETHHSILQEAAALKFISRQQNMEKGGEGEDVKKDDVIVSLLADLQQEQDKDSETVISQLQEKSKEELIELQKQQIDAHQTSELGNTAAVLMRGEQVKEANEDQLIQALEDKFDALRDKMMADALVKQMGEAEWRALSERDRMAHLAKMKLEAKKLRREGKMDELQQLLGEAFQTEANLTALMGENRASYEQRLKERLEKRRQRQEAGMAEEEIERIEAEEDAQAEAHAQEAASGNAIADLEKRFEEEKEALLAALKGADSKLQSERERQAALARLRREERKARQEDTFENAALVIGLAAKNQANLTEVQKQDRERQERLARERLAARRQKRQSDLDEAKESLKDKEKDDKPLVVEDGTDVAQLQEAVVKEMEKKHACEREFFEVMLQEEQQSVRREQIRMMSKEKQQDRLFELKELRKAWRESGPEEMAETADEQEGLLREATAIKLELLQSELDMAANGEGVQAAGDEAAVKLLAQLQVYQDQEAEFLLADIANKLPSTLQQLQNVQVMARCEKWYDNISTCLLGIKRKGVQRAITTGPSEEELVEALEEKYDALKDKLMAEALMKQMGDAQWATLSERERQTRLVKLKLQEKKLREEGRLDEAARLLGEGFKHDASLKALMGESKAKQQQRLKERLEKLKQLKQEGKEVDEEELETLEQIDAEGIESVDQATLEMLAEEITAEEGGEVTTNSLLHDLQNNFEEEKEALLAALRGADAKLNSEKLRQLELAKLRREQRKLKNEEKFDTAAILFGMAKMHEAARDASYKQDRSRQEQLARERIAAMKAKRGNQRRKSEVEEKKDLEEALIKEQEQDREADQLEAMDLHEGGEVVLQEAILNEVEKKHVSEQEFLAKLLQEAEEDTEAAAAARYLTETRRREKLDELARERQAWRMDSVKAAMQAVPEQQQTEEEKKANISRIAENRSRQEKLLRDALVYRSQTLKQSLAAKGVVDDKLTEEVSVTLLTDLQQKQNAENNAMTKILAEKEGTVLFRVKDDQRRARREGWMDNVAATIVGSRPVRKRSTALEAPTDMSMLHEGDEETAELEEEQERKLQEMDEDLEKQKEAQLKSGASEAETQAALAALQRQYEAKRKAMVDAGERQRRMVQAKLERRRHKRSEAQYEEDMAASIVNTAERQFALMREKTMLRKEGEKDTLKDRLARRRAERKKRAEEEEAKQKAEEEALRAAEGREAAEKADKKPAPEWPLPPGFAMKREKTVVEVDISEEKQKEIITSLIREHTSVGMKFERERTRQEDLIKRRREKKRMKKEQEETKAAEILGLGERQKTIVMEKQKEERDRQITTIRERIARVRYEKTMTMKEPKDKDAPQGFDSLLTEEETRGLSEEEKMKRIAAKMEEKFKKEQRRHSQVAASLAPPVISPEVSSAENSEDERVERSHTLLDAKGKERKLKERMGRRKKARSSIAALGTPSADNALQERPNEEAES